MLGVDRDLAGEPAARAYFLAADGKPKAAGTVLRNPEFAATLQRMAGEGADAFYRGEIARDIVAAVRGHPRNPGLLSLDDLADYRIRDVAPVCLAYRAYEVCSVGPSTYGGVGVLQVLGVLERFDMRSLRPGSSDAAHLLSEAERLAFADRARYGGDDRFADVPVAGLLDRGYLRERSALIRPERSMQKAEAGHPPGSKVAQADDPALEPAGTTHVSIVDREGNAVSLTSSIEWFFGSRQMVRGFLLNNQLTDFNMTPAPGVSANDVAPASGREAPWRQSSSSAAMVASRWSRAAPAEAISSATSRRHWSPRSTGTWTRRRRSTCPTS
jgi:gamma-glutamyltranspeptidase/glutathione hydrolase